MDTQRRDGRQRAAWRGGGSRGSKEPAVSVFAFRPVAKLADRAVIFQNGLGLEESLQGPLKNLSAEKIEVSRGITPRKLEGHEGHDHSDEDPHVWLDPIALITWTTNIESTLARLDPANEKLFHERAEKLRHVQREALRLLQGREVSAARLLRPPYPG